MPLFRSPLQFVVTSLVTLLLVLLSLYQLDLPISLWVHANISSYLRFDAHKAHVPDLLFNFVLIVTTISWCGYGYLRSQHIDNIHRRFFLVTGIALPLAFVAKFYLKLLFGRIQARVWLTHPVPDVMHWFRGGPGYDSFPSGHMLVLTPLYLALWYFYPRLRPVLTLGWIVLALALIATNYHFLSDVLAGMYLGAVLFCSVFYLAVLRHATPR